mmetsp:Transcript_3758/g.5112  ORF Transcript_3758/g.5112 Transcript_3758/m.5112 type:complete len:415 (-) Transcript_3758:181-1425(-)
MAGRGGSDNDNTNNPLITSTLLAHCPSSILLEREYTSTTDDNNNQNNSQTNSLDVDDTYLPIHVAAEHGYTAGIRGLLAMNSCMTMDRTKKRNLLPVDIAIQSHFLVTERITRALKQQEQDDESTTTTTTNRTNMEKKKQRQQPTSESNGASTTDGVSHEQPDNSTSSTSTEDTKTTTTEDDDTTSKAQCDNNNDEKKEPQPQRRKRSPAWLTKLTTTTSSEHGNDNASSLLLLLMKRKNDLEECIEMLLMSSLYHRAIFMPRDGTEEEEPFVPLHAAILCGQLSSESWSHLLTLYGKRTTDIVVDHDGRGLLHACADAAAAAVTTESSSSNVEPYSDEQLQDIIRDVHALSGGGGARNDNNNNNNDNNNKAHLLRDRYGLNPLQLAVLNGASAKVLKAFVECGADALKAKWVL